MSASEPGKRRLNYEQLEPLLMSAVDTTPNFTDSFRKETFDHIAQAMTDTVSTTEHARLEQAAEQIGINLQELDKALHGTDKKLQGMETDRYLYKGSALDTSDQMKAAPEGMSQMYGAYARAHERIVGTLLQRTKKILEYEAAGNTRRATTERTHVESLIRSFNNTGLSRMLTSINMPLPTSADAYVNAIVKRPDWIASLQHKKLDTQQHIQEKNLALRDAQATLAHSPHDLRPSAASIDGDTAQEIAAIDAVLEQQLSDVLGIDVHLEQGTVQDSSRIQWADEHLTLRISDDEMEQMLEQVSSAVAQKGSDHSATKEEISRILNSSPLASGLQEYAQLQYQTMQEQLAVERIATAQVLATDLQEKLTELNTTLSALPANTPFDERAELEESRKETAHNLHAIQLLLKRNNVSDAEQLVQSPVVLDPAYWKAHMEDMLTEEIAAIDATQETKHSIPALNIAAFEADRTHLSFQYIEMPEGLLLRMGHLTMPMPKGSGVFKIALADVHPEPERRTMAAEMLNADTGSVIYSNLGGFNVEGGRHTYAYENGYGEVIRSDNSALTLIEYDTLLPLPAAAAATRGEYVRLLTNLQGAQGEAILPTAAEALFAVQDTSGVTFADAYGANPDSYLLDHVHIERTADALAAVKNLFAEITDVCSERPDAETMSTLATSLNERRELLEEGQALLSLMERYDAPDRDIATFTHTYNLLKTQNDHHLEALRTFIASLQGAAIDTTAFESFLRSTASAVDFTSLHGVREWIGITEKSTASAMALLHIKQTIVGEEGINTRTLSSTLTGIDLSQYAHIVTDVRVRLAFQGTPPSVTAYRDNIAIGTYTPDADGYVHVQDLKGITHLLVQHAATSGAELLEASVMTDEERVNDVRRPLGAGTSREIALMMAPTQASWHETAVSYPPTNITVDPTQYTVVSVHGYSKEVTLWGLGYYIGNSSNDTSLLPNEFITKIDSHTWLIHPGAPSQLKVMVNGGRVYTSSGAQGYQWEYRQTTNTAPTAQELLPFGPMKLSFNAMEFDAASSDGDFKVYWMDHAPSEYRQGTHPVGTGNMWFSTFIRNEGAMGGQVTIDLMGVPENYDPANPGSAQHSLTISIEPGGQKFLHAWATIPRITETGAIIARVTYPDGRTEIVQIAQTARYHQVSFTSRGTSDTDPHQVGEPTIVNPYSPEQQRRILRAQTKLANALEMQGNIAEANRVRSGLTIAVSGGAGNNSIDPHIRNDIIALGLNVPLEAPAATQTDVENYEQDVKDAVAILIEKQQVVSIYPVSYTDALMDGYHWAQYEQDSGQPLLGLSNKNQIKDHISYTVKSGDTLSGLAQAYGIANWHTIYNDPLNAHLRTAERTSDPQKMYWLNTGEKIWIPVSGVTHTSNSFTWVQNDEYNFDQETADTLRERVENIIKDPVLQLKLVDSMNEILIKTPHESVEIQVLIASVNTVLNGMHRVLDKAYDTMEQQINDANYRIEHQFLTDGDRKELRGRVIFARSIGLTIEGMKFLIPETATELAFEIAGGRLATFLGKAAKIEKILPEIIQWFGKKTGLNVSKLESEIFDSKVASELTKISDYMNIKLKVTLSSAEKINIEHFVLGEINAKGSAVGGHTWLGINNGTIEIIEGTQRLNTKGVMISKIKIRNPSTGEFVEKAQESTFFPKDWSADDISEAISEALANKTSDANGLWFGVGKGLNIRLIFKNGTLESVFPTF